MLKTVTICLSNEEDSNEGFNISFDRDATGGFEGLMGIARAGLTESELKNLIVSGEFPREIEGTHGLPIEQRRWLLAEALPAVLYACGCTSGDKSKPVPKNANTITLPNLK